jgi:hypothetical protein
MYKQIYQKQQLKKQFIDKSTKETNRQTNRQVKKDKTEAYQREIKRFQKLLLILMYISRGQAV